MAAGATLGMARWLSSMKGLWLNKASAIAFDNRLRSVVTL